MNRMEKLQDGSEVSASMSYSSIGYASTQKLFLNEILDVILALNNYARAYVKDYIYFLIPKILQIIEKNKKHQPKISGKSIELLISIQCNMLDDYLYLIVPEMVAICNKGNILIREAIRLLEKVAFCRHFDEYIGQIVHTFIKTLEVRNDDNIIEYLIYLGKSAQASYAPFLLLVMNSFMNIKVNEEKYEKVFQNIAYHRCKL